MTISTRRRGVLRPDDGTSLTSSLFTRKLVGRYHGVGRTAALRRGSASGAREAGSQGPEMLDQLGRLVHLEVDAEHRDAPGEPSEVIVAGPVGAGVRVDRLDRSPVGRDAARELLRGDVQGDDRLESVRRAR